MIFLDIEPSRLDITSASCPVQRPTPRLPLALALGPSRNVLILHDWSIIIVTDWPKPRLIVDCSMRRVSYE